MHKVASGGFQLWARTATIQASTLFLEQIFLVAEISGDDVQDLDVDSISETEFVVVWTEISSSVK